eukprot:405612-Rhodomonas_salina.1
MISRLPLGLRESTTAIVRRPSELKRRGREEARARRVRRREETQAAGERLSQLKRRGCEGARRARRGRLLGVVKRRRKV